MPFFCAALRESVVDPKRSDSTLDFRVAK
jgi:hypothetical protein